MSEQFSYPSPTDTVKIFRIAAVHRQRYFLHAVLFLLTVATTLVSGAYLMFIHEASAPVAVDPFQFFLRILQDPALLYKGIAYAGSIMLVLLAHEMGHYIACQYYGIQATLPFFIPAPMITGTFGAFIRIRSPFPNRKALFDVGLAGPIAGFVFLLPFLYFGLKWSTQVPIGQITPEGGYFGEPIIFRIFANFLLKDGFDTFLHPMGFAVWFACLATSLNLLPIAQLDGGHVSYAVFGKKAYMITWIFFFAVLGLAIYGFTQSWYSGVQWLFYAAMLLVLKWIAGFRHPPTMDDSQPIGLARKIWAVIALIVFILTFMPVTIFLK